MSYGIGDIVRFIKKIAGFPKKITGEIISGPRDLNGKIFWTVRIRNPKVQVLTLQSHEIIELVKSKRGNLASTLELAIEDYNKRNYFVENGSKVTIKDLNSEEEKTYVLIDHVDSPRVGLLSINSPLAKIILHNGVGFQFDLPKGPHEIVAIEPPPEKEVEPDNIEEQKIYNVFESDYGEKNIIIKSHPQERIVVQAGPGTGKSYCLAFKAACLIENFKISPASILVLSFSREAVAEVKRRLKQFQDERISWINPITIDSFASSILLKTQNNYLWMNNNYDENIALATESFQSYDLSWLDHVFVDEMQDIVGIRAEFIFKLLKHLPQKCGYTFLGDFNQSIYNWTLKDGLSEIDSSEFRSKILSNNFSFKEHNLKTGFRFVSKNPLITDLEILIQQIEKGEIDEVECISKWNSLISNLDKIEDEGSLKYKENGVMSLSNLNRKALLLRTNGQIIGEIEDGVPKEYASSVRLLGKYNKGLLPAWVGKVIYDLRYASEIVDKDFDFKKRFYSLEDNEGWELDEAFELLKFIEKDSTAGNYIRLSILKKNLKTLKDIPLSTKEREQIEICPLTISTVHCSKGLEFDTVVLIEPEYERIRSKDDLIDELKLFYVGLTRAKEKVYLISKSKVSSYKALFDDDDGEKIIRWYRKDRNSLKFNIDQDEDIDGASFICNYGYKSVDDIQLYMQTSVKPNDIVDVKSEISPSGDRRFFIYHRGTVLGCMSYSFWKSIEKLGLSTNLRINRFQARIGKVYTEYRYDPYLANNVDVEFANSTEVWLAFKLTGIATI